MYYSGLPAIPNIDLNLNLRVSVNNHWENIGISHLMPPVGKNTVPTD
jgi:hypothetical protein